MTNTNVINRRKFLAVVKERLTAAEVGPCTEADDDSIAVTGYDRGYVQNRIKELKRIVSDIEADLNLDIVSYLKKQPQTHDIRNLERLIDEHNLIEEVMVEDEKMNQEIVEVDGFGIWIMGHDAYPIAMFRYDEQAADWARDNYFGQWLMKPIKFPLLPYCTEKEYAAAQKKAEETIKLFKQLPKSE